MKAPLAWRLPFRVLLMRFYEFVILFKLSMLKLWYNMRPNEARKEKAFEKDEDEVVKDDSSDGGGGGV